LKLYGGFNRHQLASFIIARRALGYGEAPVLDCLPKTRKNAAMWNNCIRYYGYPPQIQTLLHREPMEWKSYGDDNGGGEDNRAAHSTTRYNLISDGVKPLFF
jgi:hypothetical protein